MMRIGLVLTVLMAGSASRAQINAVVDGQREVKPISPLIYGSNQPTVSRTSDRLGGNRWTAWNWVTNASNAGNDYHFQNDNYLVLHLPRSEQNVPGAAVLGTLMQNATAHRATILTIPMAGYVSADKQGNGEVQKSGADYLTRRFKISRASKPGKDFSLTPNASDPIVYQDEFVNWVNHHMASGQQVIYDLDNEPDLWSSTHAEIHPGKLTYAELAEKTIEYAKAIRGVSNNAVVLGAVNYGWAGYRTLDHAPDAGGRDFQTFFLQTMRSADEKAGHRLVDALDFHWYPEATGLDAGNHSTRIFSRDISPGVSTARMQAPRSLWDSSYVESSWITRNQPPNDKAIKLLPRTWALIDGNDPKIKIAMTEYDFGGGDDISGGIAQADVLGILGKYNVYLANWWDGGNGSRFTAAAMQLYLGDANSGPAMGDTSVYASCESVEAFSLYAAVDSESRRTLTLIAINKTEVEQAVHIFLQNLPDFSNAAVYQLTSSSPMERGKIRPDQRPGVSVTEKNRLTTSLPPLSVSKIVLR